ncbi:MAG: signal peptide peptidase SppA [Acidobacteria bacterium]|nr:MAG: signal peptide peptidase SppA [Acidobacteriota bacterium]REK02845.1 MAG: signal peptide peptidase SppA [Acidobacteriota bacterium]REK13351.1 MAG: signal peptide peptidase SppA [Acidobacteriota bacterium]REK41345.1 MAG: signal peptide peptidase SppA [Acidobacteriota bacterium]
MAISKTAKTIFIVIGVLVVLMIFSLIGLLIVAESLSKPSVPENSVLVLKIAGELPDHSADDPAADLLGVPQPKSFSSLLTQLRKAKADKRIGAVLVDIEFSGLGWAKADELRRAMKDFRDSGKPLYAYSELGTNKEYYVAAAAEKIYMPPTGDIYITGFAANAMFYRGSLDKLGIEPEVIQIGKYKNAPDAYARKEMSEGQREVLNAVLDDLYGRLVSSISEDRKIDRERVIELIDEAPYNAVQAADKSIGLIDGALYRDEVYKELHKRLGYAEEDELRTISEGSYKQVPSETLGLNDGERIAVIYASGAISTGRSNNSPFGSQTVGSDTIVSAVNSAADDESIKAIVLRVDSPGGSALASDLMWHALEKAKEKKPVVVSMGDYAASGGYYIACNANKIVAEPSTLTGSIGVFLGKPVLKGFYDWVGVSNEYILRGKNAGIFRETEKWTDDERAQFQEQANNIYYNNFVPKVATGRGMNNEQVDSIGQGRVWTGAQAKRNGLVDEIGGLEKAIEIAKELANLPADKDVKRVVLPKPETLFERLLGTSNDTTFSSVEEMKAQEALIKALPEDVRRSLRFAALFDRMKKGEAMMILPYDLEIE